MGGVEAFASGVVVPKIAVDAGFSNSPIGTHTGKTMMLPELRLLLGAVPKTATLAEYKEASLSENALGKSTAANRSNTIKYLKQLYGLRPDVPVFAAMRELWDARFEDQPMLALLCAAARDVLLRSTSELVLGSAIGTIVLSSDLSSTIDARFPHRYSTETLRNLGNHIASSWTQAGVLEGRQRKRRVKRVVDLAGVVYVLYLGRLEGLAGPSLFTSRWASYVDQSEPELRAHAEQASRKGWLEYRDSGGMTEITFRHLDSITGWVDP
jgi:hypothetical protein